MKKTTIVTMLILLFTPSTLLAEQISSTWTGHGDGLSWGNPFNWNPAIVPDNNDTNTFVVTVDGSGDIRIVQNRTVDQLTCYNIVQLIVWPLWGIRLTADQITNLGTFNFDDNFVFVGDVANYGQMEVETEAEIDGNLTNHNFIEVSGGVEIGGTFMNKMGAEAYLPDDIGDISIGGNLKNDPNALIVSKGSIDVEGSLENAGQIEVSSHGFISIGQDFHNTGKVSLYGAKFDISDVFDNNSTGEVEGYGRIISPQPIQNNGVIQADGGSLIIQSNLSLKNMGSIINKSSSTLHIKAKENF